MTLRLVLTCDGHRHSQPCRGALPTHADNDADAYDEARGHGWRFDSRHVADLCPSRGHDEDRP